MKIYKTKSGILIEKGGKFYLSEDSWDSFLVRNDLPEYAKSVIEDLKPFEDASDVLSEELLAPIESQEVWASGVTYYKSRDARMDESKDTGGGDFYDRVYDADRPELFFKSVGSRVVGPGQDVRIRKDASWNVPEPELTLLISDTAKIIGYTVGNDMSSRDIEGENPLYLPQAKCYDGSAALGPCIYVPEEPIDTESEIRMKIIRRGSIAFSGNTQISQIKRPFSELVHYLFLEMSFPSGVFLMTGTGIIPPSSFSLESKDEILITIGSIGTLNNHVE